MRDRETHDDSASAMPAGRIEDVRGAAIALRGHDIDTDRIMPARFLRAVTFEGLGDHVFEDDRRAAADRGDLHPFDDPRLARAAILVANRNFGCGSSREHAPQGLMRRGIRAVVGESFSEIFFGNATMLGVPCVTADTQAIAGLMDVAEKEIVPTTVDLRTMTVQAGALSAPVLLPPSVRQAFLDGTWDALGLLLANFDNVRVLSERLPKPGQPR